MSAIAVQFHRDGQSGDPIQVWSMLLSAPYQGPDGMLVRSFEHLALGYSKLTITPEEIEEQQPLVSLASGCAISADIRLDNRQELLARIPGRLEPGTTDAELVLRGYEAWGMNIFPRLLGDFAIVIWDPKNHQVVCARDTSGQRSLYYRLNERIFAAASEIHQLFQDPAVPVEPNHQRIRDYLVPFDFYRNEKEQHQTYYDGIFSVLAGHVLVITPEDHKHRPYWTFQPPAEIRYRSDGEYVEHFRELFFEVVRARIRSVYPVGISLSGGLDSSSVACVAQQLYRTGRASSAGFASFSIVYDGLACDERDLIEDIQRAYDFNAYYIPCPESVDRLQLAGRGFQATPNSEIAEVTAIRASAHREGARTLLTGDVADACIGGSQLIFDSLLRSGQILALPRHLHAYRSATNESLSKIIALYCLTPMLPLRLQRTLLQAYEQRSLRRYQPRLLPKWMAPRLREDLLRQNRMRLAAQISRRTFSNPGRQLESELLYPAELTGALPGYSVHEARPYADRRLHEFLLAVPPEQKFAPDPTTNSFYAGSKSLLRRSMQGILPEHIRTRSTKAVFNSVFEREIEREWSKYEAAFSPDGVSQVAVQGYINPVAFWDRLNEIRSGAPLHDFLYIRRIVELETWLRGFCLPRDQRVMLPHRNDLIIRSPDDALIQSNHYTLHTIPDGRVLGPHPGI